MKTRTIRHDDGRLEIRRLLDRDEVMSYSTKDPLAGEASVVWMEDPKSLVYVRVLLVPSCRKRTGKLKISGGGRVVGYASLFSNHPPNRLGKYTRRVFYLMEEDVHPELAESDEVPENAIDPRTVGPGVEGAPPTIADRAGGAEMDSGQFVITVRGSSVILDWLGDADKPELLPLPGSEAGDAKQRQDPRYGALVPVSGGPIIPLRLTDIRLGRLEDCDVVLRFPNISSVHCRLVVMDGYWYVRDLNSTNGVRVNERRVPPDVSRRMDPGAILQVADHQFEIRYQPAKIGAKREVPPEDVPID